MVGSARLRPADSGRGLRRRILAIGLLLICVLIGSAVYDAWRLHEQLQISNQRALANLARALANEAKRNFQSVDLLLKDSADWYEEADGRLDAVEIRKELSARAAGLPQVGVLTIVDAGGRQRYRSRETLHPGQVFDFSNIFGFLADPQFASVSATKYKKPLRSTTREAFFFSALRPGLSDQASALPKVASRRPQARSDWAAS